MVAAPPDRTAFQSEGKLDMVLNYLPGGELFYRLKREGRFSLERVRLCAPGGGQELLEDAPEGGAPPPPPKRNR